MNPVRQLPLAIIKLWHAAKGAFVPTGPLCVSAKSLRHLPMAFLSLLAVLVSQPVVRAWAGSDQNYPERTVTIISPAAGGATDAVARIIAAALSEATKAPFIVNARPGAGGNVASETVARAPADGYTLLLALNNMLTVNPILYKNVRINPIDDFAPVALIATSRYLLVANPTLHASTVKELIEEARAKQNQISYGSSGYGTPSHLIGVLFNADAGVELQHVPYRSISAATVDLLSGQVQTMFGSMFAALPLVQSGQLKALGVTGQTRSPMAPNIPTIGETIPGFEFESWYALVAPAKTPPAVVSKLAAAVTTALGSTEVQGRLLQQGAEVAPGTSSELSARIRSDLVKWTGLITAVGVQIDEP